MRSPKLLWCLLLLAGATLLVHSARAAEFSPNLEAQLAQKNGSDFVSAIVILPSPVDIQALDEKLHAERAGKARRHQEVLDALLYNAKIIQPAFKAELDQAKLAGTVQGYTAYWIENLFVIYAQKDFLTSLRTRGDIKFVTENFQAELIRPVRTPDGGSQQGRNPLDTRTVPPGIKAIGALRVNEELGITGNGVIVGNMDTGVDGTHPALAARWRGVGGAHPWQECWHDAQGTTTFPTNYGDHGTHVMGTMCGRAVTGTDTTWIGCAPNAQWIADRAVDQDRTDQEFINDVIDGFQWFADPDGNPATVSDMPDVVQNSWGVRNWAGTPFSLCFDQWNGVITNCEAAGVVVTWSAGNESSSGPRAPAGWSLNEVQMFSVGAVDASAYPTTPYPIASFSSLGPTTCTPAVPNNIKPEISAPGVNIYSSIPGGGYDGTYSGTSMAGPHVAGIVALMREACPDCDPTTIKMAIINTAIRTGYVTPPATENNTFGNGFIDGYAAVLAVSNLGRVAGVVRDASNAPLQNVTVKNAAGSQSVLTNASGQYYLPLQASTYTIEYSKFGYITQSIPGIVIVTGDTTIQNVTLQSAPQGTVSGIVTGCSGGPAVGATVEVLNVSISPATTNGSGFYSITLPQGTYDMRASGAGCGVQTVTGVVIGATATQNFTLPTDPHYLCSTPDAANYTACEDVDPSGPTFSWRAVAPSEGGSGTLVTGLTDDSYGGPFTLPFTFKLYGTTYTQFYVGSNGYVTFGRGSAAYSNGCLPDTVPAGLYMFWDDLYPPGGGQIAYYNNTTTHELVIEFYQINHYSSGPAETFEAIIRDVAYYPTTTGDNDVIFQYNTAASILSNTVGIQNAGTVAQLYLCGGVLPSTSLGLTVGRAILFSTGHCFGTSTISFNPSSVTGYAAVGGTDSRTLQICNIGSCPLAWSLQFNQTTPLSVGAVPELPVVVSVSKADALALQTSADMRKFIPDEPSGRASLDNSGGPDAFGYRWKDSNESGGPVYNWVEIKTIGTNTGLTGDDQVLSFRLPWSFPFYGSSFDTVRISSNGNLHFGAPSTAYSNTALPGTSAPFYMIAPFWDDLDISAGGHIYYYNDAVNHRYIVQFDSVPHWSYGGTGMYTFEAILSQTGGILLQYRSMSGLLTSATVGIQNGSGTVGLQVVYNAAYVANSLAIQFTGVWLKPAPTAGSLPAGQCGNVTLGFDASSLAAGTYTGQLVVQSNDPVHSPTTIPITFVVGSTHIDAPDSVTIFFDPGSHQITLHWSSVPGAVLYSVFTGITADAITDSLGSSGTNSMSFELPADGLRFYHVTASNGAAAIAQPAELPRSPTIR
jgi:hypothetical protein